MKPAFIDLSHHNSISSDLIDAQESGIMGVIHKCTEGTTYKDEKVEARYYLTNEAGLLWGVYHFVRPGSMRDQVDFFLRSSEDVWDGNTLFALDWEDTRVSLDDAIEFMAILAEEIERSPVLYSGHVLKEALGGKPDLTLSRYRLWLAQYASEPELPPGWDKYWGWQYTDKGTVPGIAYPVDLNAFDGTEEELVYSWPGNGKAPEPVPEPGTVRLIVPKGTNVIIEEV